MARKTDIELSSAHANLKVVCAKKGGGVLLYHWDFRNGPRSEAGGSVQKLGAWKPGAVIIPAEPTLLKEAGVCHLKAKSALASASAL